MKKLILMFFVLTTFKGSINAGVFPDLDMFMEGAVSKTDDQLFDQLVQRHEIELHLQEQKNCKKIL
jgi:uncharacterized membrane protein SpoIIM required for sporulation